MTEIPRRRSLCFVGFFVSIFLQFLTGYSDDSSNSKNGTKAESHSASSNTGTRAAIIFFVLGLFGLLSFFLFKFWQKKKREEQYARLLKLFEEDDELEMELGLRD